LLDFSFSKGRYMRDNPEVFLKENETIDDLQYKGLMLIQKEHGFRFGVDAVLLANFAEIRKGDLVLDIGTGTGIIPILIAGKTEAGKITGLEIQEEMAEMAERSVKLNNLQDRITIVQGDIKNGLEYFGPSKFNLAVCNPPYMNKGGGIINNLDLKAVARHEITCTLEDIIKACSRLIVPGGRLAMVHRPERIVDVLYLMRLYSIEPKFIRFVHPSPNKKPNLFLVQGTRGGNAGLKVMDPLYVYNAEGNYSDEINRIYHRIE